MSKRSRCSVSLPNCCRTSSSEQMPERVRLWSKTADIEDPRSPISSQTEMATRRSTLSGQAPASSLSRDIHFRRSASRRCQSESGRPWSCRRRYLSSSAILSCSEMALCLNISSYYALGLLEYQCTKKRDKGKTPSATQVGASERTAVFRTEASAVSVGAHAHGFRQAPQLRTADGATHRGVPPAWSSSCIHTYALGSGE